MLGVRCSNWPSLVRGAAALQHPHTMTTLSVSSSHFDSSRVMLPTSSPFCSLRLFSHASYVGKGRVSYWRVMCLTLHYRVIYILKDYDDDDDSIHAESTIIDRHLGTCTSECFLAAPGCWTISLYDPAVKMKDVVPSSSMM